MASAFVGWTYESFNNLDKVSKIMAPSLKKKLDPQKTQPDFLHTSLLWKLVNSSDGGAASRGMVVSILATQFH